MTLPRDVRERRVLVCNEVEAGPFSTFRQSWAAPSHLPRARLCTRVPAHRLSSGIYSVLAFFSPGRNQITFKDIPTLNFQLHHSKPHFLQASPNPTQSRYPCTKMSGRDSDGGIAAIDKQWVSFLFSSTPVSLKLSYIGT